MRIQNFREINHGCWKSEVFFKKKETIYNPIGLLIED